MLRAVARSLAFALIFAPGALLTGQEPQNPAYQPSPAVQPAAQTAPTQPPLDLDNRAKLSDGTRMQLIQLFNAELVRVRKSFPIGYKDISVTSDGKVKPEDGRLNQLAMTYGPAAKIGDLARITNIAFHEKSIYFEINGGPKKKTKWYQHVTIGGMGGSVTPGANDPNQGQPTGAAFTLEFKKYVPEMTGPELKQLLNPVFDFSMKSAAEVYMDTLPPKAKEAIKNHQVLVGMNRDMVVMAKDRPPQKVREKDEKGQEYEEWIYGAPPQEVTFIRFSGDEVSMVKTMKVGGETVLKTQKEVDVKEGVVSMASVTGQGQTPNAQAAQREKEAADHPQEAVRRPTLKRAGEEDTPHESDTNRSPAPVNGPNDHKPVPQWGSDGQEQPPAPPSSQTQPPMQ